MKSEKPGSARLVYCIYVALIIFICMIKQSVWNMRKGKNILRNSAIITMPS